MSTETVENAAPEIVVAEVEQTAATVRDALSISGDVRVSAVSFNIFNGQLVFEVQDGELDSDGFVPHGTRQVNAAPDLYKLLLPAMKELNKALKEQVVASLDMPAQAAQ
jgi:hypothetical protein